MRTQRHSARRSFLPALFGLVTLAACDAVSGPASPTRSIAAASLSATKSGVGGSGMVPFTDSADFHALAGAPPITCAPTNTGATHTVKANQYVGAGPATHLGMTAASITFASCRTIDVPVGGDLLVWVSVGPFTLEAANGDLLEGDFSMSQYASGRFVIDSANITGGTGRFANASGQAKGGGVIDRSTLSGHWKMSGLMTRPNS